MGFFEIFMIGVGLSMDAFAASVCKGLSMRKAEVKNILIIALFFGGFQALMPLIGYFLGNQFESYIVSVDHWIAFTLLVFIGGKMIIEVFKEDKAQKCDVFDTIHTGRSYQHRRSCSRHILCFSEGGYRSICSDNRHNYFCIICRRSSDRKEIRSQIQEQGYCSRRNNTHPDRDEDTASAPGFLVMLLQNRKTFIFFSAWICTYVSRLLQRLRPDLRR